MYRPWVNLLAGAWALLSGLFFYAVQPINFFIIGLWLIFSAFIPMLLTPANLIISGRIIMAVAGWRIATLRRHHPAMG